jgi:predicted AAA+ superfamily ATPase
VAQGTADVEYQDPREFFARTYLTEGLRDLLVGAARRLSGGGGNPVIELQTNFGGGKTHTMIALYHLASGADAGDLPGVGDVLGEAGVALPEGVARAVLVGHMISPSNPPEPEPGDALRTMWGHLAYQLGGRDGYELVRADDEAATNPGAALRELFELCGPAVVLIDEWVAYARQLRDGAIWAFSEMYRQRSGDFPSGVGEAEYRRRMELSYPIHPELFDRLFGDWSALDKFQRTRGVLRPMALAISQLWQRGDRSLLIMPSNLPMDSGTLVSELKKYLEEGWDPVIKSDVDGTNSLPSRLDVVVDGGNRPLVGNLDTDRQGPGIAMAAELPDHASAGCRACDHGHADCLDLIGTGVSCLTKAFDPSTGCRDSGQSIVLLRLVGIVVVGPLALGLKF